MCADAGCSSSLLQDFIIMTFYRARHWSFLIRLGSGCSLWMSTPSSAVYPISHRQTLYASIFYYLLIPKMIYKNTISSSEDMHLAVIALSHWLLTVYYAFGQTGIVHFIESEFVLNYCQLLGIRYQLVQLGGFWPEARKCHTSHKYRLPPLLVKHRILPLVFTPTRYFTDYYYYYYYY